jgi:cytoskeletal protein CcmA (bactofilin family)
MNSIGASVVIKGNITAAENLAVAGRVEGDIHLDVGELMLAPGSHVVGDITVPAVIVHGSVQGSVAATERVDVRPGACVVGSVAARTLVVADGAQMNCRVEMPAITRPHLVHADVPVKLPVAV